MIDYEKIFENDIQNQLQVYFTEDSGIYDLKVNGKAIDKIIIKDGYLKIHDSYNDVWHCYNMKYVKHFHFPGGLKLS